MESFEDGAFPARKDGLVISELGDETLVYDPETQRASCLNGFAAAVLALCDGQRAASTIARELPYENVDERVVLIALADLEKARLLGDRAGFAAGAYARTSRRALLRRLGLGTAVAVPVVTGIVLPAPAQLASPDCKENGSPCDFDEQCCSDNCETEGGTQPGICQEQVSTF